MCTEQRILIEQFFLPPSIVPFSFPLPIATLPSLSSLPLHLSFLPFFYPLGHDLPSSSTPSEVLTSILSKNVTKQEGHLGGSTD